MNKSDRQPYFPIRTSLDLSNPGVEILRQLPPPDLASLVLEFWQYKVRAEDDYMPVQVFPSGCVTLRFDVKPHTAQAHVYGPSLNNRMKGVFFHEWTMVGVAFRPGSAGKLLGVPLQETRDLRVEADCLWPHLVPEFRDRMFEAETFAARVSLLADMVRALRINRVADNSDFQNVLKDLFEDHHQPKACEGLAKHHGLNHRTMRRLFQRHLGLGAKEMGRVVRVQRVLQDLSHGRSGALASMAVERGVSDQSHLSREVKGVTGHSPWRLTQLLGALHEKSLPEWAGLQMEHRHAGNASPIFRFR